MNTTWENDGFKASVAIPIGSSYPASTLVGKTLTAWLGLIGSNGTVTETVAPSTISFTEAGTIATITALWPAASLTYGIKRCQFVVTVPGDKPYTVFDKDVNVLASLG